MYELTCRACLECAAWPLGQQHRAHPFEFFALSYLFAALIALAVFTTPAWIDHKTHLLPDILTLPLLWTGLLVNSFANAVQGAVVGYCALWFLAFAHQLFTGYLGMAHGDYKLAAALGAWFGLAALYSVFLFATILGLLSLLYTRAYRRPQAFGPRLTLGAAAFAFMPLSWRCW